MNDVNTRVRDELRAIAHEATARPELWERTQRRIAVRRRRRISARAITGIVTVALLITAVALTVASPRKTTVNVEPGVSSFPSRIVAETFNHHLVVLDARTGTQIRDLTSFRNQANVTTPRIAVSPDGRTVWFERERPATPSECSRPGASLSEIARVNVDSGHITNVVAGSDPAISPDGTKLAYATREGNKCAAPNEVVVTSTANDAGYLPPRFITARDPARTRVDWLAWSPDNRHLLVGMVEADTSSYPRILDTRVAQTLENAPRVDISDATQTALVYRGVHGDLLGWSDQPPVSASGPAESGDTWATAINRSTGRVTKRLFPAPQPPMVPPEADPTGDHILAVVNGDALYRWSAGDARPTRVTSGILAAAWLPDAR